MSSISSLIEILESARERKSMYFSPLNRRIVNTWIHGIHIALHAWCIDEPDITFDHVAAERGWTTNALGFDPPLEEQGMSDEEIVDEILTIEIERWKRHRDQVAHSRET